jgi:SpoVK/Ycf46/Vps4 family AAA+-type ATPase
MARGDLLTKLFRSYKNADNTGFLEAATHIIEDERKKHHSVLASELSRILNVESVPATPDMRMALNNLPRDTERGTNLLDVRRTDKFMQDLVLSDLQLDPIREVLEEYQQHEILEANGLRPRTKLLFCGPPGCGKTVTAEAIANELGLPLLYVRFDSVVSSLLGETATNLRKVFEYAARGTWVLFFDEFDAVGRSRDDAVEHGELKRVVNTFLQLLDGFQSRSLVIAATNFEQVLDPALWRRFDEIIRFEKPNRAQIEQLLQKYFLGKVKTEKVLHDLVDAFLGLTHAEIERVCLDALRKLALKGSRELTQEDVSKALVNQQRRKQALARAENTTAPRVDQE